MTLLALPGCATTEEQRFPLDYPSGQRAAMQPGTAREAFAAYKRMGAELERQGRFAQAAIAYSNAFASARALGRLQDALETSQKAVEMAERTGNPRHIAPALIRLGQTHMDLNAPQRAIPVFEKAAQHAVDARHLNAEGSSYIWLSRAYRRLRKPDLARENTEKAVSVLESAILRMQGGRVRPGSRREGAVWNMERNYANALLDLGWNDLALNRLESARTAFQKALEAARRIGDPHFMAQAQQGLGRVAAGRREFQAAMTHLQEALRLSQHPRLAEQTQRILGRVYYGMGNLTEAERALRKAVASIEDMRSQLQSEEHREAFVEDKMGAYAQLIQVLFDQRKLAEALDMSERARARAFLDLLGNRVSLTKGANAALIAEEKALQERIAQLKARESFPEGDEEATEETTRPDQRALQRELDLAREAYRAFLSRVRAQSREQASLMTVEPLTVPEVQALLEPGTVLLEYFVGEGRTLVWVVSRNSLRAFRLRIGEEELARRVGEFRELIASRGRAEELRQTAHDLYQALLAPALPAELPRELIIVPHRVLHYLPFHALMPAPDRCLIQEAALYYYSSASLMQFTRAKARGGTLNLFGLGNPDLNDPTLNLRYAEREVRAVADLFPQSVILVQRDATKTTTREHSPRHTLLHFATHAELDEADPLGSAL
ncbi:MAG: CHAT domain-containing protein, partial [candidate division NC10 bacterium]|nr:CHAT domain-containing protein [candidate division NC10 bacterium]